MFVIFGKNDNPLYESKIGKDGKDVTVTYLYEMHSSLDNVEDKSTNNPNMFLREVDKSKEYKIYSFVTASDIRMILLIMDNRSENSIYSFFKGVYELLVKALMNPLYKLNSKITSDAFDYQVKLLAQKNF